MDDAVAVGYDEVDGDVEGVGVDFVDELEVVAYADGGEAAGRGEQAVVIAFAAAHAVAGAIVGYGGDDHEVNAVDVYGLDAVGLFNPECSEVHPRAVVGEDFEVEAVYAGEVEFFACVPAVDELAGGKLVGKGVVH